MREVASFPLNLLYQSRAQAFEGLRAKNSKIIFIAQFWFLKVRKNYSEPMALIVQISLLLPTVLIILISHLPLGTTQIAIETNSPIIVFTGAMDYSVNVDGVLWFVQKCLATTQATISDPEILYCWK